MPAAVPGNHRRAPAQAVAHGIALLLRVVRNSGEQ
jgi:hypothetical protein